MGGSVLIVDDEKIFRKNLAFYLKSQGYTVNTAESAEEALIKIQSDHFDVVIADYKMDEMSGQDLLREAKAIKPSIDFVAITGFGSIPLAVEMMQQGASDFITKPFEFGVILNKLQRIINARQSQIVVDDDKYANMIVQSQKMKDVMDLAAKAATSEVPVLIEGERGTGREIFARTVHRQSLRSKFNFITVECSVFSDKVIEGREIDWDNVFGDLEKMKGGTLFLRDVCCLNPVSQSKVLKLVRKGIISQTDDCCAKKANVRVLASTSKSLKEMIVADNFREDLYYYLNVMPVYIPPLRARIEDIVPLANYFLTKYSERFGKKIDAVTPEVLAWMETYHWPGNVRELENIIARACALAGGNIIDESLIFTLPEDRPAGDEKSSFLNITLKDNQRAVILKALKQNGGNYSRTAAQLGISRTTLWRRMKKFKIEGIAV